MSDLVSFAELIKQANQEKKRRQLLEVQRLDQEVAPLLSELFLSVAKAKELGNDIEVKENSLLAELQSVLEQPEKIKKEKYTSTVEPTTTDPEPLLSTADPVSLTQQTAQVETPDINRKIDAAIEAADKRFLVLFNRLQSDMHALKRHVDSKPTTVLQSSGYTGGGGEVRILRMDDVSRSSQPVNGNTLVWSTALNKFELKPLVNDSTGTDEDMPFSKRVDFISDNVLYKGEAAVGSAEDSPVWRIRLITIASDQDIAENWAQGSAEYNKRWTDRLTYNYS